MFVFGVGPIVEVNFPRRVGQALPPANS
jgi:hypothetical protein